MTNRPRVLATLEGYAVEGGFDRAHEPTTCYRPTITLGRHAGPGTADGLWHDYERVIELVPALGLDGVRLSIEWARVEPRRGAVDGAALGRYRDVIDFARALELDVTIVLVDAVWPAWLGLEAWLLPWTVPHVLAHASLLVRELGDVVTGVTPFSDATAMVERGFLSASAPPWRRGATDDARSARAQIERIVEALTADSLVGPRLVGASRTIALDKSIGEITAQIAGASDCDEIYLRSLVRGSGPTQAPAGLLVKRGDVWATHASPELISALG